MLEPYSESNSIDSNHPNFTPELDRILCNIQLNTPYIGCIGCGMPIAYQCEISGDIANARYPDLVVAYAVPISIFSLMLSTTIIQPALNHWETRVNCSNCRINLSIPTLTIYNRLIEDYCFDDSDTCAILDAASVALYQREYVYSV